MDIRVGRGVEEITILYRTDDGKRTARTVYRRGGKRKRGTGPADSLGGIVNQLVASQEAAAKAYRTRHKQSNREKSDGWARDLPYNVYRATRRGLRKVRGAGGLPTIDLDD
jgi:hypothetical protein